MDEESKAFVGKIKVYYLGLKGKRIEVFLDFFDFDAFTKMIVSLEGNPKWELHTAAELPPIAGVSSNGKGPYSCPVHGDAKIYANKKGGAHSHYCGVKEDGVWCGQKVYR